MTISLYQASVPLFKQMLAALADVLGKAEADATIRKFEASILLQARLYPDMFPLIKQVQIATDFARGACARLAGVEAPVLPSEQSSFADLAALISESISFVESLQAAQIDGQEDREIILRPGTPKEKRMQGQAYLIHYALPQFFFHVTTSYAILRNQGVEVGKRDFMGVY
jgi:uncharacterized protein